MKLAVLFPGIGYHGDKPLLYYSRKAAGENGYQTITVSYGKFPEKVRGSEEKMRQAFRMALEWAEETLKDVRFQDYREILFISKSVGTAVAAAFAAEHGLNCRNIYFTPVKESFSVICGSRGKNGEQVPIWEFPEGTKRKELLAWEAMEYPGIVFHGTKDPWVDTETVREGCRERSLPLWIVPEADHSLETGAVAADLKNLNRVMRVVRHYMGENIL